MKLRAIFITIGILGILSVGMIIGATPGSAAPDLAPHQALVGTVFTYQGFITDTGSPANGTYDFLFKLFNDASAGTQVGSTVTKNAVPVADGYFTVELDFGDWFDGTALWLEIEVQGPGDLDYTLLESRQALTPVPYAISASKLDGLDASELYTKAEVDALLAAYDSRITALEDLLASVTTENGGQDLVFSGVNIHIRSGSGTTDGAINGLGNLIVGYNENPGGVAARTGSHNLVVGQGHSYSSYAGFVAGLENTISGKHATVSGGRHNIAGGEGASIQGGGGEVVTYGNIASGVYSSISGGRGNQATGSHSSIAGGVGNWATNFDTAVCGGFANIASGMYAAVSGGEGNEAAGPASSVSGGLNLYVLELHGWAAGGLFWP